MQVDPLAFIEQASRQRGMVHLNFPFVDAWMVNDPDLAEEVLVNRARDFGKTTHGYRVMRRMLGNGLVTSDGSFWLRQRRIAQPAFHRGRIATLAERMTRFTGDALAGWQHGASLDIHAEMMRLTLRIVASTLLSADVTAESASVGEAMEELLAQMIWRTTHPFYLPYFVPTPKNRRFAKVKGTLDALVFRFIAEHRATPGAHSDLLTMLMEARDEDTGEGMSDLQLRDEAMTIFLAGHETTANVLSWAFACLSQHPEAEARAREEIRSVVDDRTPTAEDAMRLPFLSAVVKETLRLYPPVWVVGRGSLHAQQVGDAALKEGSLLFISPWVFHHDETLWSEPLQWKPERWLSEEKHHRCAYMPFIVGPRKCIGDSFALLEATLVLAMTLSKFSLHADAMPEPDPSVTLRPKHGLPMRVSRLDAPGLAHGAEAIAQLHVPGQGEKSAAAFAR